MASDSSLRPFVWLLLTSGFFVTGLLFDYMPGIVDDQIKRRVELATNEEIRAIWSRPPVDLESYFWLYHISNPEQFLLGEKIQVKKVGPYYFTSRVQKRIIELSANKFRLIYNTTRNFHVNESIGPPLALNNQLDQQLTLLNPIYASMVEGSREFADDLDPTMKNTTFASVNRLSDRFNETLLRLTTPREALLGRYLPLIEKAKKMGATFGVELNIPDVLPNNVFGYVAILNNTSTGPFEIYTGYQASASSLGDIISYQGKRRLTQYQGKCNRMQASAGELRPMPIANDQKLEMYLPNLCRIVHLKPTGTRKLSEGESISYIVAPEDLMSAKENPDNRCFCVNRTRDDYCSLSGAIELAPCAHYAPVVVTMPHVQPDPLITENIQDWDSDLTNSEVEFNAPLNISSQVLILKRVGVPIRADLTITMFMKVTRDPKFRQTASVPELTYVPIVMVRETVTIPPNLAQIIVGLESFIALTYRIKLVMYLSAIILLCWLTGNYYGRSRSRQKSSDRLRTTADEPNGELATIGTQRNLQRVSSQLVDSTWSSERADSADSSRSQPPSQTRGKGSIDAGLASLGSGDSTMNRPPSGGFKGIASQRGVDDVSHSELERHKLQLSSQTTNAAGGYTETNDARGYFSQPSGGYQEKEELGFRADVLSANGSKTARLFSKVDEQLQRKALKSSQYGNGTSRVAPVGGSNLNGMGQVPGQMASGGSEKQPRGWFVRVCSNFVVRMLNGLKSSITEASQLNVTPNDYQDKQLEKLAGKIDNWYSVNERKTNDTRDTELDVHSNTRQRTGSSSAIDELDDSHNKRHTKSNSNNAANGSHSSLDGLKGVNKLQDENEVNGSSLESKGAKKVSQSELIVELIGDESSNEKKSELKSYSGQVNKPINYNDSLARNSQENSDLCELSRKESIDSSLPNSNSNETPEPVSDNKDMIAAEPRGLARAPSQKESLTSVGTQADATNAITGKSSAATAAVDKNIANLTDIPDDQMVATVKGNSISEVGTNQSEADGQSEVSGEPSNSIEIDESTHNSGAQSSIQLAALPPADPKPTKQSDKWQTNEHQPELRQRQLQQQQRLQTKATKLTTKIPKPTNKQIDENQVNGSLNINNLQFNGNLERLEQPNDTGKDANSVHVDGHESTKAMNEKQSPLSSAKIERRDSGVKLDSHNGISGSHFEL